MLYSYPQCCIYAVNICPIHLNIGTLGLKYHFLVDTQVKMDNDFEDRRFGAHCVAQLDMVGSFVLSCYKYNLRANFEDFTSLKNIHFSVLSRFKNICNKWGLFAWNTITKS